MDYNSFLIKNLKGITSLCFLPVKRKLNFFLPSSTKMEKMNPDYLGAECLFENTWEFDSHSCRGGVSFAGLELRRFPLEPQLSD